MPTREAYAVAALALLIFFVAFNLQAGWVYAVDALLVGLLVAGFVSTRLSVRGITLRRAMPAEACEGEPVSITLTLNAPGRVVPRFFLEVTDAVPGLRPARESVPLLRPGRAAQVVYASAAVRRGVHDVESVTVRSAGLTGLFAAQRVLPAPGRITIYPRYWQLSRFPLLGWTPALETSGASRQRGGLEFYGLRDYRHGDSLRHVHWRSTARRGAPVVREFEQEIPGSVTLLIDTRPLSPAWAGPERAAGPGRAAGSESAAGTEYTAESEHPAASGRPFEDLVRAAASIAWFVTRRGGTVRLLLARGERPLDVGGGWRDVLQVLAEVEPDGLLSPADVHAGAVPGREGSLVILTSDADAVRDLVHRGAHPAAVLAESSASPAASPPADGDLESVLRRYAPRNDGEAPRHDGELLLRGLGVPVCVLRPGDDIGERLEQSG